MDSFYEIFEPDFVRGVLFSLFCGLIIGFERQLRGKPVGIRTSTLICLGTMVFVYLGEHLVPEQKESARILGQIVAGIGFLGAGVIMTRDGLVSGVTSAAIVWLLAAVGASIGFKHYGVAVTISILAVMILVGVEQIENVFKKNLQRGIYRRDSE